ncbi:hypothetical protein jhhlp_004752 [Lomentospora prolificans]|uniref:Uncharacterized protein n=1 Tax=Lomentospora prolificans TaxID=41688 RepID=A0A2N3N8C0_9PEZI|nr:hypothetical protein jhhlp_004752 [Lomentospora prolificans]
MTQATSDTLFHTLLTVIDYHVDKSGGTQSTYVLGTHTSLPGAKSFSKRALRELGYEKDDFSTYEEASSASGTEWTHGDGVIVHAKAPAGQVFNVSLDTKPNTEKLPTGENDEPKLPPGSDHLHYVLQTQIDYNKDRNGAEQTTEVQGTYVRRADAMIAAKGLLNKSDYEEYDERDENDMTGKWEYGEDVVVHAVSSNGENFDISVRTVPGAHKRHGKKKA